jgi:hypothetical protein
MNVNIRNRFLIFGIVIILAVGIIPTVLITMFYERKPINPYLPALVVWLLGILYYVAYKIISLKQDISIDPIGQLLTLLIMAIAVISSCISWAIAKVWTRRKGITGMKMKRLVMALNIFTVILPLLYLFVMIMI